MRGQEAGHKPSFYFLGSTADGEEKKEERGKREIQGGRNFGLLTEFEGETLILGAARTEMSP